MIKSDPAFVESSITIGGDNDNRMSKMTEKGSIDAIAMKIVEKL